MHFLRVPHRLQEEDTGCLAACAQMVLDYLGIGISQAALNRLLGLTSIGTPYSNIRRLTALGVKVNIHSGDENDLRAAIDNSMPPVAFVKTGDLPYWQGNTSHAVLLVGYDDEAVYINDPIFASAPQRVGWDEFMLAWDHLDNCYALIGM